MTSHVEAETIENRAAPDRSWGWGEGVPWHMAANRRLAATALLSKPLVYYARRHIGAAWAKRDPSISAKRTSDRTRLPMGNLYFFNGQSPVLAEPVLRHIGTLHRKE